MGHRFRNLSKPATETSSMALVSSNHVVVRRVMGCARSSGNDKGLQDNVAALLVQSLLHAWNIAPGASCGELPLDQELRARGQRVLMGKAAALPRLSTLSARLARQKPCRAVDGSLAGLPQNGSSGPGCSHSIQSVAEAAGAAPHRAWPWPLTPAQPHPVRPQPNWPEATAHPPSLFDNFARRKLLQKKRENSLLLFSRNRG